MGDLMGDGYYIEALPRDWRSTHTYKRLFGQLNIEVGPSPLPSMQFSTSHNISGCIVHFAMVGNTLVVRATEQSKSGSTLQEATSEIICPTSLSTGTRTGST
ncbi:hypothetical protein B0T24DRAFT_643671 [Lasiosphaeria ovina]|uniref:Uncharacterized protein n=1 Tax=Lasiosphaeria ovina TaxID=92902 RepID=A0AAE0JSU3_9PEZI|nr:hypothetical protein B0T24DRAFT_643671 [Lasiosphaeria ovina]